MLSVLLQITDIYRREFVPSSGTPIFVAATQGTSLDSLPLMATRIHSHRSHKTVTEKKKKKNQYLTGYHFQGTAERQQTHEMLFL